jgi:hypothetical protein
MRKPFFSAAFAAALLLNGVSTVAISPPAAAQTSARIGFDFFHNRLANEGRWMRHPVWGDVWRPRPRLVGADFQPYTNGYWQYTDEYGWYWVSNDPFDDVVYHYGRWVYDPQYQWLWVPGYTWAPAWVIWREGDDYTGWMPMPPDEEFASGGGFRFGVNIGGIGIDFYNKWYGGRVDPDRFFVFVNNRHLVERDYRRFVVSRDRIKIVLGRTRPATKFEVVNNRVVNRGVDLRIVERATGKRIAPVSAKAVIKPNAVITTVDEGNQIRTRERASHPIDVEAVRRGKSNDRAPGAGANGPNGNAASGTGNGAGPNGGTRGPDMNGPGQNAGAEAGGKKRNDRGASQNTGGQTNGPAAEPPNGSSDMNSGRNWTRNNGNQTAPADSAMSGADQTGTNQRGSSDASGTPRRRGSNNSSMNSPDQTGSSRPGDSDMSGTLRRRGGNNGSMSGPGPANGAATGTPGEAPNGKMMRHRNSPPSNMNGPGKGNPSPSAQASDQSQPGSTDAQPKKKRKSKAEQQQSESPQ